MLREWIELLPLLTGSGVESPLSTAANHTLGSVVVHHGCVAQVVADSANRNAENVLSRAGYKVASLPRTVCCGALDLHSGNRRRAFEFSRANIRSIKESDAEFVVSTASGCSTAMAEYGELFKDDPELAPRAREVSARVAELSTLLMRSREAIFRRFECTVTYHDACHLAHGLRIREQPRALLRSIPGVKLIEMAFSDLCCGSAGTHNLTQPAAARALAKRKADTIMATGADFVVLANPGCQFQIAAELRRRGSRIKVLHLADFVAQAANSEM